MKIEHPEWATHLNFEHWLDGGFVWWSEGPMMVSQPDRYLRLRRPSGGSQRFNQVPEIYWGLVRKEYGVTKEMLEDTAVILPIKSKGIPRLSLEEIWGKHPMNKGVKRNDI